MSVQVQRVSFARRGQSGFTLMELLITVTIVSILTAVAVPSYGRYVLRTARADARATLLQGTQFMERFYAVNGAYDQKRDGTAVQLPLGLTQVPQSGISTRYNIALVAGNLNASGYTLQAVPTGPSAPDECGTISLTSTGVRGASGKPTAAGIAECWR